MKSQEELLQARLGELARRCQRTGQPQCSRFLPPQAQGMAQRCAQAAGVACAFDGGWAEAERTQCCFYPPEGAPAFTGRWLQAAWNPRFGQADHRALLGSLMALGMERELLGDIVVEADRAFVRAVPELAARLPGEWDRAGAVALRVTPLADPPDIAPPQGKRERDTVASLRLDAVLASGLHTSRAKAAEWIRQGKVEVDHRLEERCDAALWAGAVLSVRGWGRMILREVGRPTPKGRLPLELEIFAGKHGR